LRLTCLINLTYLLTYLFTLVETLVAASLKTERVEFQKKTTGPAGYNIISIRRPPEMI